MSLKTDYKDSVYTQKRYIMNEIGADVTFTDATEYNVEGDYYGAENLNEQNRAYNKIESDYAQIDRLVSKLNSYGITVSDRSPSGLNTLLNNLANNKYNAKRTEGQNYIKNNYSSYNFETSAHFEALKTRIREAKSALETNIPYTNVQPGVSVTLSDPITSAQATSLKSALHNVINTVRSNFTSFYNTALNKLTTAANKLDV